MNDSVIWDYLYEKTKNPFGTAALMGNLMAESSLRPVCATGIEKAGYVTVTHYISESDSGKHDFAHDGVAFGLVQWCYYARKGGLLDFAQKRGKSVGDLMTQLEYMWKELQGYKSVLNAVINAVNIRSASDIIMLKYEKPGTTTEAAKQKRAAYGQKFYDQFAEKPEPKPTPAPSGKKTVMATVNVNLRAGVGKDKDKVGELKKGKTLEVIGTENGWCKVAVYVMKEFVKEVE